MIGFSSAQRVCERDKETDRETDGETKLSRMSHCDMSWLMMNYSRLYNHLIHEGKPSSVGCVYCPNYAENFCKTSDSFEQRCAQYTVRKVIFLKGFLIQLLAACFAQCMHLHVHIIAQITRNFISCTTLWTHFLPSARVVTLREMCVCVIWNWDCK